MDDNQKMMLKIGLIAVAAYLGYRYLQSSGLWAQWFGSVNPDQKQLPPASPVVSSGGFDNSGVTGLSVIPAKVPYQWLSTKVQ